MELSEINRFKKLAGLISESTTFKDVPEEFKKRFSRVKSSVFYGKNGEEFFITLENKGDIYIRVYVKVDGSFHPIGHLFLHQNKDNTYIPDAGNADAVFVEPSYRRNGIARSMYDFAESFGLNIIPAPVQSKEIQNFWNSKEK